MHRSARPLGIHRSRGVLAAELALVIPVLLALLLGAVELGHMVHVHNTLLKSLRVAARHVSMVSQANAAAWNTAVAEAKNLAVCGQSSSCTGEASVVPNLSTDLIAINKAPFRPTGFVTDVPGVSVSIANYTYMCAFGYFSWGALKFKEVRLTMRGL